MKLVLAAGGTGGHMFPAQALAEEAKGRGWSVLLITDARGNRYTAGFPANEVVELKAASPSAKGLLAKARAAITILLGVRRAQKAMKDFGAEAVVGFGGYPSAPTMMAAARLKLPRGIHEQNAVLGRANRLAAGGATFLAHGFPKLLKAPSDHPKLCEVGNPVRRAVQDAVRPYDSPVDGPLRLLIFGGSQGAKLFAEIFPPALDALPNALKRRLKVTHQVSEDALPEVGTVYEKAGIDAELAPFFTDLPERIAAAHLVVARSGASSVAELSVIGRPSLLIPLKIAMDDHQKINAEVLVDAGAAEVLTEDELRVESATRVLWELLADDGRLTRMAAAAKGRIAEDAARSLADLTAKLAAEPHAG